MKKRKKVLIIALGVFLTAAAGFALFLSIGLGLKDAPVKPVDITKLPDGTYAGELKGSRFANRLEARVSGGKITDIRITDDMAVEIPGVSSQIFSQVMQNRLLQADCVSGATVSSKAYLKALENALNQQ